MQYRLSVNGVTHSVEVDPDTPLLWVLRDTMNMKGTKYGCGAGICGACTVHVDGVPMRSCQTPISSLGTQKVTTIEGIGTTSVGKRVQEAWLKIDVMQCGYCQPGQIMEAAALLSRTPHPTDADINDAMESHICRCGTYTRIRAAIKLAAEAEKVG
jgi:isoquinoline 1-oxidoreductase alpha subunit